MYNYVKSYADRFKLFDEIKFKHEVIILEGIFHEYKKNVDLINYNLFQSNKRIE